MVFERLVTEIYKHLPDSIRQEKMLRRDEEKKSFFEAENRFITELVKPLSELSTKLKKESVEWPVKICQGDETKVLYRGERGSDEIERRAIIAFEEDSQGIGVF